MMAYNSFDDYPDTPKSGSPLYQAHGRLLLMDGQPNIRAVLARILERIGFEVVQSENGNQAVQLYMKAWHEGRPFELVILDLFTRRTEGVSGGQRILQLDATAQIIATTGYLDAMINENYQITAFAECCSNPTGWPTCYKWCGRCWPPDPLTKPINLGRGGACLPRRSCTYQRLTCASRRFGRSVPRPYHNGDIE